MHVVVMNPAADPRTPFNDAALAERSFGEPARWEVDYAGYARAKAQLAWREQTSLRRGNRYARMKMPHERDESTHAPNTPNPVTAQGARDVEQGKVDTDCYDAAGPRYDRTQKR